MAVDSDSTHHLAVTGIEDPPIWSLVVVTVSTGVAVRAKWDGEQWWTESELPLANHLVINWRTIN